MVRGSKRLSAAKVRTVKRPGFYSDGDGLYLQVGPAGTKSWVFRYTVGGQRRGHGMGRVNLSEGHAQVRPEERQGTLGLAEARDEAQRLYTLVRRGIDPIEDRYETQQAAATAKLAAKAAEDRRKTFAECAEVVIAQREKKLRNDKSKKQWRATLTHEKIYAVLNDGRKIDELTKHDVAKALKWHWEKVPTSADRFRDRIKAVFTYAKAIDAYAGNNPAEKTVIEQILGEQKYEAQTKHPALPHKHIGAFMAELRKHQGTSHRALEFGILTAARSGEVRGATWNEIDMTAKLWTIPAGRMKAGREHVVTLSDDAVKLLQTLPRVKRDSQRGKQANDQPDYMFPAARGGQLSDMALTKAVRDMHETETKAKRAGWVDPKSGRVAVVHGFRSTFRDWTAETGYERDMAELALAHDVGSAVERAYRRTDMVERRRHMMQDWADYCTKITASSGAMALD
ncbi:MAG: tyrosine-type recombinase/integrase [Proteobacteria bacterium]|nr:tyrosine-type recombinase/integrase [Pseudomonadota bacterium]